MKDNEPTDHGRLPVSGRSAREGLTRYFHMPQGLADSHEPMCISFHFNSATAIHPINLFHQPFLKLMPPKVLARWN